MVFLISSVQTVHMDINGMHRIRTALHVINGLKTALLVISMKVASSATLAQTMIQAKRE